MVSDVDYPAELQLNVEKYFDTESPFRTWTFPLQMTKFYNEQDDLNFETVNFLLDEEDVHCSHSYGVYISQLIRFARYTVMFMTSTTETNSRLLSYLNKAIDSIRKEFSKLYH